VHDTKVDGTLTRDIEETTATLLDVFVPDENDQCCMDWLGPLSQHNTVDEAEIKNAIWRMKTARSPGKDGITAGLLRKAWPYIKHSLCTLFNACLDEATFPKNWKSSRLVIIPKTGKKDMTNPKTYRPISLLLTLGKALETIIIRDLVRETGLDHIGNQHGFTPGRSTITAINQFYSWSENSKSRHIIGVFLDISGAFDNVKWSSILVRLQELGASLRTTKMIKSYLTKRDACLTLNGWTSRKLPSRGCPQGSQLGPTLWKVAMTDINLTGKDDDHVR